MEWQPTLYAGLLLASSALMLVLAAIVWPRRASPGGSAMIALLLAMLVWSAAVGLESMAVGETAKVAFSVLSYPGATSVPVLFYLFCLDYTQTSWPPARRAWLFVIPALATLAAATNAWHGLLWPYFAPGQDNAMVYGHGPAFYVLIAYSYSMVVLGQIAIGRAILHQRGVFRRQFVTVLFLSLIPLLGSISYVVGVSPFPYLDPSPIVFSITAVGLTWSVLRQGLLTIVPLAQELVLENLRDGVLALDPQDRVVVTNAVLRSWFRLGSDVFGHHVREVFAHWPDLLAVLDKGDESTQYRFGPPEHRVVDVDVSTLSRRSGRLSGRIVLLRDVTELDRTQAALMATNRQLTMEARRTEALQDELREQALRDGLTGLFNRRYLEETLDRELARARRLGVPLSIIMIDLDHFKELNDQFGHEAGDRMLRHLGMLMRARVRGGDIACRFGGEEFMIVLPGAPAVVAHRRADELREEFQLARLTESGQILRATFSAGAAEFPTHADNAADLRRQADHALYAAKRAGRNRVLLATG